MTFLNKLKKALSSKAALVVYSVAIGIIAWLLVLEATNPVENATLTVQIKFANEESLTEKDLVPVKALSDFTAEVKVSGKQSILKKLSAGDISLTVDLSKITGAGGITLAIESAECYKRGVKIIDYTPKELFLTIEQSH